MHTFRRFSLSVFALMAIAVSAASPLLVVPASGKASESAASTVPDAELTFIDLMITHHATAIAMSNVVIEQGEHPDLVQFALEVVRVQQAEVARMQVWRDAWYPDASALQFNQIMPATAGMSMMDPIRAADMLRSSSGPLDRAFIDAMILHDLTSVMMAEMIVPLAQNVELADLAHVIIDRQDLEIDKLRGWRAAWYGGVQ